MCMKTSWVHTRPLWTVVQLSKNGTKRHFGLECDETFEFVGAKDQIQQVASENCFL